MLLVLRICKFSPASYAISEFLSFQEWHGDPIVVWQPVVEPEIPGTERFLTAQPLDLIRKGKFHQVPAIFGVNKDEFGGVVACTFLRTTVESSLLPMPYKSLHSRVSE